MENLLIPFQAVRKITAKRVLVLAPHPDDEVFGCGGAIMRHVERHVPVQVIIVTNGAYGVSQEAIPDYIRQRQQESLAAAVILGYGTPDFWQYHDRDLFYGEKLITEILTAIHETGADLVYAPSVYEIHPDHRALGMATVEAVRRTDKDSPVQLALYEVGLPMRPNLFLDISDLAARKMKAMGCFTSQNANQRYDLDIAALNRYRTYTLPAEVTAAEAYILTNKTELSGDPFRLYQSEHARQQKKGLALDTKDIPLVSVIIRSTDRPTLTDALDSIALQTYANIEVIVVNAKGPEHSELEPWCGRFPLRMVTPAQSLQRSSAANTGLQAAAGAYLIFLDDDDLFLPEHIAHLVSALQQHTGFRCAYAGVRVDYYVNEKLETSGAFNEPFDQRRLWGRNFIPIHAILFERTLLAEGCCFDEQLDLFEDWDFWVQISQHTSMLHVDKIGAVYRNFGHSGLGLKQDKNTMRALRGKFYNKWKTLLSGEQLDDLIEYREEMITGLQHNLAAMRGQLASSENQIETLLNQQNRLMQESLAASAREASLQKTINDLTQSTSWKITAPLRFFSRILRGQNHAAMDGLRRRFMPILRTVYWWLPAAWRDKILTMAYRIAGPFFSGMNHYELWRSNSRRAFYRLPTTATGFLANMIDLSGFSPSTNEIPGSIAIHAHIFYPDLAAEFAKFLRNMPFAYDLFVSTPDEAANVICKQHFTKLPRLKRLTVTTVPNRGRDIAPMFCAFGDTLKNYDYIAHIHSKKSLYNNGATDGWREYLLTNLFGSDQQIRRIFTLLTDENKAGLVYPQNFARLPYSAYTWLSNQALGRTWCNKLGIHPFPAGYFDFPAGSMFWARTKALHPLFEAQITIEDFPEEAGQTDATLAHCLERLLVLVTKKSGFNAAILRDIPSNSWSRWRFEQYLVRKPENIQARLSDSSVQVVVFDIFDTLLTRPLLYPERIKSIIAQRAGDEVGKIYLDLRATAESQARQKAGRDISLDAIFKELAALSGLSPENIEKLRHLEEITEMRAVAPRTEVIALLYTAIALGKHVVLASDMYLPKSTIEAMLKENGITGWHRLYVSSDLGLRKDTGDLYRHLLSEEQVTPNTVMVIGDNEHSDIQIPGNMDMKLCHILRPVELARTMPRLGPLIEKSVYHEDLNVQLTLGTLVQETFQPVSFPGFDPSDLVPATPWSIGFAVAGPLILAFVQWLTAKAAADGIQHLLFLSREGQILKTVYDRWTSNDTQAVASDYLVISRRTVTVPMISNLDDIFEIARIQFSPNTLTTFIEERFGFTLSSAECDHFAHNKLWPKNKRVSVEDQNIDHLIPLLRTLEEKILAQAEDERTGLFAYLDGMKFNSTESTAVVDIGYAATIQGRLNRLLHKPVHGYYLVTEERAQKICVEHNVIAQGCFGHYVNAFNNPPLVFKESFSMEKLLSSNDPQIVRYHLSSTGDIVPEFRKLTETERQTMTTRAEIQRGIMDFVDRSIAIRAELVSDFIVPSELAKDLFETFVEQPSRSELDILRKLTLDDYYCGRGLVS
ncbi:rhamnan synthesis F family protein [Nitrosomonas aestuarii]|uniref:rhamnan synthesis F family protein n=1 Tax=Nitrosomonas aestuarii TaxID=52441 RepID=UPI000D31128C|nr:rhamnan synthesis F family protein [Nitrosomonas aestuarii]PTN12111.1 glycosyl transferase family 2 [Nitrosomonas aestuarii]